MNDRAAMRPGSVRSLTFFAGAAVFLASMGGQFRTPLLPAIGGELGMTSTSLGLIGTAFGIGRLLTDIPAGILSDRFAPPQVFAVSGLLLSLGAVAFATATVPAWALIASLAIGVASATANTAGVALFLASAVASRRGRAMAGFSAALLAGQAAGPTVAGAVASGGGWRLAMWSAAGIGLGLFAAASVGARRGRRAVRRSVPASDQSSTPPASGIEDDVAFPLQERLALYGVSFMMMFTLGALPQTLIPIIGGSGLELTVATIGTALGVGGVARFVGTLFGGWLSDRYSRKRVLVGTLLVYATGITLLAFEGSVVFWFLSIIVMSLSSFSVATASAMVGDRARRARMGREIGSFRFVGDWGLVVGPVLAAAVLDLAGQRAAVVVVVAVVVASACAVGMAVPTVRGTASAADATST